MNYYICMCRLMCKNLEYISLLQSRAMLAEPSKMHRNRPLAVHPATVTYTLPDFPFICSLLSFIFKDNNILCCIYNLLYPLYNLINNSIIFKKAYLKYIIITNILEIILYTKRGYTLIKQDIADAF